MTTATLDRTQALLRRLPLPTLEPAYDDERAHPLVTPQDPLRLAFTLPSGVAAEPASTPRLRLVPPPGPSPDSVLPDPRGWAARLVQAVMEVLAGDRPRAQLLRWTSAAVYNHLEWKARTLADSAAARRRATTRPVVHSVRVDTPGDGVVEVAATVMVGGRARAVAARLEDRDGRWLCTTLRVI